MGRVDLDDNHYSFTSKYSYRPICFGRRMPPALVHRYDESARLSPDMVASPQSQFSFHLTVVLSDREKFSAASLRIISDNGPQFIAKDSKEFIRISGMPLQEDIGVPHRLAQTPVHNMAAGTVQHRA